MGGVTHTFFGKGGRVHQPGLLFLSLSSFTMEEKNLLKTCIKPAKDMYYNIALRGYKKPSSTPTKIETLDMDSRVIATFC